MKRLENQARYLEINKTSSTDATHGAENDVTMKLGFLEFLSFLDSVHLLARQAHITHSPFNAAGQGRIDTAAEAGLCRICHPIKQCGRYY